MPGRLRDPGPGVKDARLYEALREDGNSKEKSARIANAAARTSRSAVGHAGGKSGDYEDWTVADLRRKAADVGVAGRSRMRKSDLISALRGH
ncbi:Rho termination factor N-terminal domain-containing protein [soil metagenome]